MPTTEALPRLLQLASTLLPVGAYSYSQGLEAAIAAQIVRDPASARAWLEDGLELVQARFEAPIVARLHRAFDADDSAAACHWNAVYLASRESAEFEAETRQMGYSALCWLAQLLPGAVLVPLTRRECAYPSAFSLAAVRLGIGLEDTLTAWLWAWSEGQVAALMKALPMGQSAGQRLLLETGARLPKIIERSLGLADDRLCNATPMLAMLSARHETQTTRLFRS